ncbi:MAG: RHS repeat-associated core domain-containing protein, partial [Bacillota bacterium]|nr:RHS repeat-associated core domain-containing protein [Bacillota bacterium]
WILVTESALLPLIQKEHFLNTQHSFCHSPQLSWGFSSVINWTDETITIDESMSQITVTNIGQPLEGISVYVFDAGGTYLNITDTTDINGQVAFRLPAGDYNFRADYMGSQYFSGVSTLVAHVSNPVNISTGGGSFTLTALKGPANPLIGVDCYLFTDTGSYLNQSRVTNDQGEAGFDLADGSYKIRVDYLGYQFWTNIFTIPADTFIDFTIPHQDVTVTVNSDYNGDVIPLEGISTFLFTASDTYLNLTHVTDAQGEVTFNLPQMDYKVRADYLSQQYWSPVFNWTDETISINEAVAEVHVTQGSTPIEGVPVYVYTASDSYLNINGQTDANGIVSFKLPEGTYKFRGDYQNNQYWATESLTAHQVNVVNLSTGGGSFTLAVEKESGTPLVDVPVYVFSSSGSYLGICAHTDAQGVVSFDLADGDYKFRADYFGYQFLSDVYTVPGTLSDVLTITHQDVTVTVNQVYGVDIDPLEGVTVYLFTGSGSYQGINQATDANGQVTFNVPERDYKVRADYMSAQYWSDVFSWQDAQVDISHGTAVLHVTENGQDVFDVPVYLFTDSGSYLGQFERTDSSGQVQFLLPADSYKFRVDYDGTQYWSDVIPIIPHEENNVDLQLELLADLTRDPNPDRFDGVPPVYEPEKIMVASLGSIRGLLVQSVVGQTAEEQKIYYFINDHLGAPQKLLDESAGIVWSADYKPFGEADVNVNAFANRFRFPGQYFDEETGLHYNYHRYYEPSTGRYLRPDPIGLAGGIHLFSYVSNNPVINIDPLGLFCKIIWGDSVPGGKPLRQWETQEKIGYWDAVSQKLAVTLLLSRSKLPVPDPTR